MLFSLHLLSSLWHRTGANVVEGVANGLLLLLLIHMTATMARHDPEGMRRRLVILMIGAGVVFMLGSALTGATSGIGRAVAFGGGPNVFVRIMVWAAIAVVVIANTRGRRRWLILLPALLLFAALSGSRGGITAAAITAAVMALVLISKLRGRHVAATVVLAPAVIWFIWTNDQVQYLLTRRFTWSGIVDSGYGHRETLWLAGWQIFQESPVAGQGMDAFNALAGVSSGFPYPHNVIIEFADDMGIIGISVLTALFMVFVRLVVAHNGKLSASQYGLIAAVVFTLVASLFSGDIYDSRFLWIFMVAVFPLAERPAKLSSKSQVSPKHNIARK
ncbi:O-antigen ligase family protein [Nesterenkonia aurantiaca]|uniref:O-antigen ligase family protein n=1 Tax=Nesterenkonia aurantiaca TaxID=1436010 RepID=UPI003EE7E1C1